MYKRQLTLSVIGGHDPKDSTSVPIEVEDIQQVVEEGISGLRMGLPREFFQEGIDGDVRYALDMAVSFYKSKGFEVREISLPHTDFGIAVYYIVADAEASSNLARYDGVRYGYRSCQASDIESLYFLTRGEGFGSEVKRRIMLGTYALSAGYYEQYYLKALKVRTLIVQDFKKAFEEVDVIIAPTSPTPAFKIGEKISEPLNTTGIPLSNDQSWNEEI